jgi:thymidylate synthase ThyX
MKVTAVSTSAANLDSFYLPTVTYEENAAIGARFSRSKDGFDFIYRLTKKNGFKKLFSWLDYGHRSINDMATISMYIEGVTAWLAFYIWYKMPRAVGQESSTRYIDYGSDAIVLPFEMTGMPESMRSTYDDILEVSRTKYACAVEYWSRRIPQNLTDKQKANFVYDRSRNYIPASVLTNVRYDMTVLDWCKLIVHLKAYGLPETLQLAGMLEERLRRIVPSMVRHINAQEDTIEGCKYDRSLMFTDPSDEYWVNVDLNKKLNMGVTGDMIDTFGPLDKHPHRYSWIGNDLSAIGVDYWIPRIAFAELRDLNRHRPGIKLMDMFPVSFYNGTESVMLKTNQFFELSTKYWEEPWQMYLSFLGTEYNYGRKAPLPQVIYEIELRTGAGGHYRYVHHMTQIHNLLCEKLPKVKGKIILGSGEPE